MTVTNKELGEQVNTLRSQLGMKPYKEPTKKGAVLLQTELHDLQQKIKGMMAKPAKPVEKPKPVAQVKPEPVQKIEPKPIVAEVTEEEDEEEDERPTYTVLENLSPEERTKLMLPGQIETIRSMSERLLTYVGHVDQSDKRSVGILYNSMLALIHEKFPKAKTSVACLRWYAVHMRSEGKRMPQKRPRPPARG